VGQPWRLVKRVETSESRLIVAIGRRRLDIARLRVNDFLPALVIALLAV
jgi:uncharacterized membrane protein YqgA involved in biofilm formation